MIKHISIISIVLAYSMFMLIGCNEEKKEAQVFQVAKIEGMRELPIISFFVNRTLNTTLNLDTMTTVSDSLEPQIIISIWADGTMIYSSNHIEGGKPYYKTHLSTEEVDEFLKKIRDTDFWDVDRRLHWYGLCSDYSNILINDQKKVKLLCSWHELVEQNPSLVVTHRGIQPFHGNSREEVLSSCSDEYIEFLKKWNFIRSELVQLIEGKEGRLAGDVIFEYKWIKSPG